MKNPKSTLITDALAVERLKRYIDDCDADEIARLLGDIFGGECYADDVPCYEFFPNKFYAGEFDDLPLNEG